MQYDAAKINSIAEIIASHDVRFIKMHLTRP